MEENNKYNKGHVIIAGVPKCGTSSLYKYMSQHPNIIETERKELDYLVDTNHNRSRQDYFYNHLLRKVNNTSSITDGFYTIDASPAYFYFAYEKESIKIAEELVPEARLVFMFRHPADRLYSNFHMNKNFRKGERSLQGKQFKDIWKSYAQEPRQIIMSDYVGGLKKWNEYFPRENMLLLIGEEFFKCPVKILFKVYDFLGIEKYKPRDLLPVVPTGKSETGRDVTSEPGNHYEPLQEELKQEITEYYKHKIEEFTDYTGIDTDWLVPHKLSLRRDVQAVCSRA